MILMPDLFSFAYVPNWYSQLDMLAEMALPEPWRFKNPIYLTKNPDTPILERYIHAIFKKQLIDYTSEQAIQSLLLRSKPNPLRWASVWYSLTKAISSVSPLVPK